MAITKKVKEAALAKAKKLARGGELRNAVALTKEHNLPLDEVAAGNPDFITAYRGK